MTLLHNELSQMTLIFIQSSDPAVQKNLLDRETGFFTTGSGQIAILAKPVPERDRIDRKQTGLFQPVFRYRRSVSGQRTRTFFCDKEEKER